MSFLFLWKSANVSLNAAAKRFTSTIERQVCAYERAFGRTFTANTQQIENIFIGQIEIPTGVVGWQPWQWSEECGVAWAGVCETMLGRCNTGPAQPALVRTLFHDTKQVAGWNGRFAAAAWDVASRRITLVTSAEDCPAMWQTEGQFGWAVGSRSLPLLELVGRKPALDMAAASLFVGVGYLAGQNGLLEHVRRVGPRQQVIVTPEQASLCSYITLPEYAALHQRPRDWNEVIHEQAEHLVGRVRRQIEHSAEPRLLLTGGRDSRCIAAVAVAGGAAIDSQTSGTPASTDVRIARQVAAALHLPHAIEGENASRSPVCTLLDAPSHLNNWLTLTEGAVTLRHALAFTTFFAGTAPFAAQPKQLFHGLHGLGGDSLRYRMPVVPGAGADEPIQRSSAFAFITNQLCRHLQARDAALGALNETLRHVDEQIGSERVTLSQWFNLYYWHNRTMHWGADDMAFKDVVSWHWTPLLDGSLSRARLHTRGHSSRELLEDITHLVAPALRRISYDKKPANPVTHLKTGVKWALVQARRYGVRVPHRSAAHDVNIPIHQDLLRFWNQLFFSNQRVIWPKLLDESFVRTTIRTRPSAEILWNLATVERMAQTIL